MYRDRHPTAYRNNIDETPGIQLGWLSMGEQTGNFEFRGAPSQSGSNTRPCQHSHIWHRSTHACAAMQEQH